MNSIRYCSMSLLFTLIRMTFFSLFPFLFRLLTFMSMVCFCSILFSKVVELPLCILRCCEISTQKRKIYSNQFLWRLNTKCTFSWKIYELHSNYDDRSGNLMGPIFTIVYDKTINEYWLNVELIRVCICEMTSQTRHWIENRADVICSIYISLTPSPFHPSSHSQSLSLSPCLSLCLSVTVTSIN